MTSSLLIQNRQYRVLWASRLFSLFGGRFSGLALPQLILQSTGSPLIAGLVIGGEQVAHLCLSIPVGVWVEKRSKRNTAIAAEVMRLACMGFLTVLVFQGSPPMWLVAILLFAVGASGLVFGTAYSALIVFVVGRARLQEAYNLTEGADAVSTLLGPAIAGVVFLKFGAGWAIAIDTLTFAISLLVLCIVRVTESEHHVDGDGPIVRVTDKLKEAFAGVLYITRHHVQRVLLASGGILGLTATATGLLIIVMAEGTLQLNAAQAGMIFSAMGAGNLIAVLLLERLQKRIEWFVLLSMSFIIVGLGAFILAVSTGFWTAAVGAFLLDGALSMAFVIHASNVLVFTPDHLLTRVSTASSTGEDVARLFARIYAGGLAEVVGARMVFLLCGAVLVGGTLIVATVRKETLAHDPSSKL